MKKPASWVLVIGLLAITFSELRHYAMLRHRYSSSTTTSSMVSVYVPRGVQRQVTLPDGTTVNLNAASRLAYPRDMMEGPRIVELTGEAFFSVASISSRPFRVKARDMTVQVLGTTFDLRDYPEETVYKTIVENGSIKVLYNDEQKVLHEGEEADVDITQLKGPAMTVKNGRDIEQAIGWTKGIIEFENADLQTVLNDLSRAYNVDIQFEGTLPANKFYGSFSLQEPLEEVIQRLDFHDLHVSIKRENGQKLTILAKPS